jgi:hypothetical protein
MWIKTNMMVAKQALGSERIGGVEGVKFFFLLNLAPSTPVIPLLPNKPLEGNSLKK